MNLVKQFSILIIFLSLSYSIFGQAEKDGGFSVMKTKNPNVNQMKYIKTVGASTWEKTKNPNVNQIRDNKARGASTWEKTKNPSIDEIEQKTIGTSYGKEQINSESTNINKRNKNEDGIKSNANHKENE